MNFKKAFLAVSLICMVLISSINVFAYSINEDDFNEDEINSRPKVVYTVHAPDDFSYAIKVFRENGESITITKDMGYTANSSLKAGVHSFTVICGEDFGDKYLYSVTPETIDIQGDTSIDVYVTPNQLKLEETEENIDEHNAEGEGEAPGYEPEPFSDIIEEDGLFDFSKEGDSGTLRLKGFCYACANSIKVRIIGKDGAYDAELLGSNSGKAEVKLPIGDYKISPTVDVVFRDDMKQFVPDDIRFDWESSDITSQVFTVKPNETVETPLLKVVYTSDAAEIFRVPLENDDLKIVQNSNNTAYTEAIKKHENELISSAFSTEEETSETVIVPQITSAPENTKNKPSNLLAIIGGVLGGVILLIIIIILKRKHDNRYV